MKALNYMAVIFALISMSAINIHASDPTVGQGKDKYKLIQGKRYKVGVRKDGHPGMDEIDPVPQTGGIKTGFVAIYGHVVKPPYNLTVKNDKLFLNAVPVGAMATEKGVLSAKATDLVEKAKGIFCDTSDKGTAANEIISLFEADKDLVVSAKWRKNELPPKGVLIVTWKHGAYQPVVQFQESYCKALEQRLKGEPLTVAGVREAKAASQAKSLRESLRNGDSVFFDSHGGVSVLPMSAKEQIGSALKETTMARKELIEKLEALGLSRRGALDVIKNYAVDK